MGVKVSLSPSAVCPRTGCWSTHLNLIKRKWQKSGQIWAVSSFVIRTPHQTLFGCQSMVVEMDSVHGIYAFTFWWGKWR